MKIKDPWFKKICDSYRHPPVMHNGEPLPGFPPDELQANTTGQAGIDTLREAFVFYEDCATVFDEAAAGLQDHHTLLDFGVGWGRIARFFLKNIPKRQIYGIDVTPQFVELCRKTFGNDNFYVCQPFPPTAFEDNQFDYIVGYSVFSHLSEQACGQWMREFHRILKPGGMLALTTRGRPFFDFCERLKGQGYSGYLDALSKMFTDFGEARRRYDDGEFVHSNAPGVNGGGSMNASFYGETFIPEDYARKAYAPSMLLKRFLFEPPRQTHPIMFFRKALDHWRD